MQSYNFSLYENMPFALVLNTFIKNFQKSWNSKATTVYRYVFVSQKAPKKF